MASLQFLLRHFSFFVVVVANIPTLLCILEVDCNLAGNFGIIVEISLHIG